MGVYGGLVKVITDRLNGRVVQLEHSITPGGDHPFGLQHATYLRPVAIEVKPV